jgi:DNA invertase Pin-like site-specific DNA recombinase
MLIGYARVSTKDQDLSLQLDELKKTGCERVFEDVASGTRDERPGLDAALEFIRTGDTLVVWRLDRLARSLTKLIEIVDKLNKREIGLRSVKESLDTTTPGGKLIFHVFGALSQFEAEVIRERTNAGLEAARARGRFGGRPFKLDAKKIEMAKQLLKDENAKVTEVSKALGISRATLYRYVPSSERGKS